MTAPRLMEDEAPYGEGAKIIPISQKARTYLLDNQPKPKPRKFIVACRPSREPRHSPRLVTELYNRFVAPLYPSVLRASRQFFLHHTMPFLLDATCANAAAVLSAVFYSRHAKVFSDCGKVAHMRQTLIVIAANTHPPIPPHVEAAMATLKTQRQREALRIITNLAAKHPDFYLSCRDLQARLLLPSPMTAYRILERLCKAGCIERLNTGQSRQSASQAGFRAMAATFRLAPRT